MAAYLKEPTILFHSTLARKGRLFAGSEAKPLPHPGKDWVDSPADLEDEAAKAIDADAVIAANASAEESKDRVAALEAEVSTLTARAEAAEEAAEAAKGPLNAEKNNHAETKAMLAETENEVIVLTEKLKALEPDLKNLAGLTEQVEGQKGDIAKLSGDNEALRAQLAKFDHDGDGKAGGRK